MPLDVFHQSITGKTGNRRSNCFPHGATVRLPTARSIHLVQCYKPTGFVTHCNANVYAKFASSLYCLIDDCSSLQKGEHNLALSWCTHHALHEAMRGFHDKMYVKIHADK